MDYRAFKLQAAQVADWRLQTFELYAQVRSIAEADPAAAHAHWARARNKMFGEHPASALSAQAKAGFDELPVGGYDPDYRFQLEIHDQGAGELRTVRTGTDGEVQFERLGTVAAPGLGSLALWRHSGYGGGIFLPFRDDSCGLLGGSYGAGRYLLDTIKGAHLGAYGSTWLVDFNFAYNPSCAYDETWACPLPGPESRLSALVPVGELYAPALNSNQASD